MKSSLLSNFVKSHGKAMKLDKKEYDAYMTRFVKRLSREGLLGDGLKKPFTWHQFNTLFI